ncbi:YraN family protein [Myxococcota bacterium]
MLVSFRAQQAERAVARYLRDQGYLVVGRNVRLGHLELDIVARDDRTVVVVEVRTRGAGAFTSGFGSIDRAKRRRLRWAGERLWRNRYRDDPTVNHMRFDAASVTFSGSDIRIEYCKGAF